MKWEGKGEGGGERRKMAGGHGWRGVRENEGKTVCTILVILYGIHRIYKDYGNRKKH